MEISKKLKIAQKPQQIFLQCLDKARHSTSFARILRIVLISFFFKKTLLEMRYTPRGRQPRVSEISKKLKIAQKPQQIFLQLFCVYSRRKERRIS